MWAQLFLKERPMLKIVIKNYSKDKPAFLWDRGKEAACSTHSPGSFIGYHLIREIFYVKGLSSISRSSYYRALQTLTDRRGWHKYHPTSE